MEFSFLPYEEWNNRVIQGDVCGWEHRMPIHPETHYWVIFLFWDDHGEAWKRRYLPAVVEVVYIDIVVWGSLPLTPKKKTITSRKIYRGDQSYNRIYLFHSHFLVNHYDVALKVSKKGTFITYSWKWALTLNINILNGESENDRPYETESHLHVTINDLWIMNLLNQDSYDDSFAVHTKSDQILYITIEYVSITLSSNGNEFDSLSLNECKGFVHICNFMESHLSSIGTRKILTRDHFQKKHQFKTWERLRDGLINNW